MPHCRQMEHENILEQNRYSKSFVGLSKAEEAESFTEGNDKGKNQTPVWPLERWTIQWKFLCGRKDYKIYHKMKSRCTSESHVV